MTRIEFASELYARYAAPHSSFDWSKCPEKKQRRVQNPLFKTLLFNPYIKPLTVK